MSATPKMSVLFPHLVKECGDAVAAGKAAQFAYIDEEHWVPYPHAKSIMKKLEEMLKGNNLRRKIHLLIKGDSNNGKSTILEEFETRHPIIENPTGNGIIVPFLLIEVPYKASDTLLYNEMLKKLKASYRPKEGGPDKHAQVIHLLQQVHVRMLGFDELHNIRAGSKKQQETVLNQLKYFGNSMKLPIAAASLPRIEDLIQTDDQWDNRFEREALERWKLDSKFLSLLSSFEQQLPLPAPSHLANDKELVLTVFHMSEGLIGELATLLRKAAKQVIESSGSHITLKILQSLDWTPPSRRRMRR